MALFIIPRMISDKKLTKTKYKLRIKCAKTMKKVVIKSVL